jgi:hypothetical protein
MLATRTGMAEEAMTTQALSSPEDFGELSHNRIIGRSIPIFECPVANNSRLAAASEGPDAVYPVAPGCSVAPSLSENRRFRLG